MDEDIRGGTTTVVVMGVSGDTLLERPLAVKVPRSEFTGDATFRARFRAEAQHTAALHDPNIASVFDYGEAEEDGQRIAYLSWNSSRARRCRRCWSARGAAQLGPHTRRPPSDLDRAGGRACRRRGAPRFSVTR